jgi:hypothetical protein
VNVTHIFPAWAQAGLPAPAAAAESTDAASSSSATPPAGRRSSPSNTVLTTNFDELIERATLEYGGPGGAPAEMPAEVLKLHGTRSALEAARFTSSNVFAPLEPTLLVRSRAAVEGRVLVFVGYGGEDEFDVLPALLEPPAAPSRVVWVVHATAKPMLNHRVRARLAALRARGCPAHEVVVNTDAFLKAVYQRVVELDAAAAHPHLEQWAPPTTPATPGWWKSRVSDWGSALWASKPVLMAYLWARILDKLRVYSVRAPVIYK